MNTLLTQTLLTLIGFYQRVLSPIFYIFGANCRFMPTCSEHMRHSVQTLGPVRGFARGMHQLLRCHPFCRHGWHPLRDATKSLPKAAVLRAEGSGTLSKSQF